MKEDCDRDPGWCFKSAITTVLPASFGPQVPNTNQASFNNVHPNANMSYLEEAHSPFLAMVDLPMVCIQLASVREVSSIIHLL